MTFTLLAAELCLGLAVIGVVLAAIQATSLCRHLGEAPRRPTRVDGVSVLKPLCGVDDDLLENLRSFAQLEHANFEVLLGLERWSDGAAPVAREAVARWPGVFRIVLQDGAPGQNPKVNQLITLARAARHDVLVVSDSNIRAPKGYIAELAALLEDESVGMVTNPTSGAEEASFGSLLDGVAMAAMTMGTVAAQRVAGKNLVIGKSMALRRRDLQKLGGFEVVKDILAEDYAFAGLVPSVLGRRVAIASTPVLNVTRHRTIAGFVDRYVRWHVMFRFSVQPYVYWSMLLLNPFIFAALAALLWPGQETLVALGAIWSVKALLDASARAAIHRRFRLASLVAAAAKEPLLAWAWLGGLTRDYVVWRGHRLRVGAGTRLTAPAAAAPSHVEEAA